VADWGSAIAYRGHPEGTSDYLTYPVTRPEDWGALRSLDPGTGMLGLQLQTIRRTRELAGPDIPILMTIFIPLSQAKHLIGKGAEVVALRRDRAALQLGLETITETTARYVSAALEAGADGIFYAVQHASAQLLSDHEYREVARPLDLLILSAAREASFNLLHLHGQQTYLDMIADYPIHGLNWHDRETGPDLGAGARRFPGLVVGGLSQRDMIEGSPETVRALACEAIAQTGGRLCLSTGCVLQTVTPWGNIRALRAAADEGLF
jgi:uroporphyrinogen decarboxylase